MSAIITVTEMPSMPGRFTCSVKGDGFREMVGLSAGHDPSAAAAKAMELSITHGRQGYAIFGPQKVLDCIPPELRRGT